MAGADQVEGVRPRPVQPASHPAGTSIGSSAAEHLPYKEQRGGSSPPRSTRVSEVGLSGRSQVAPGEGVRAPRPRYERRVETGLGATRTPGEMRPPPVSSPMPSTQKLAYWTCLVNRRPSVRFRPGAREPAGFDDQSKIGRPRPLRGSGTTPGSYPGTCHVQIVASQPSTTMFTDERG